MTYNEKIAEDVYRVRVKDIRWSIRVFLLAVALAFILSIAAYLLTLAFAEPEPVSEAIINTASAATAKVEVTSSYIDPMWSLFIFNSIAAICAVIGTGLFMMVHNLLIGDISMRPQHPIYARSSILFEKALGPLYNLLIRITALLDRDFSLIKRDGQEKNATIWKYCGYGKDEYRMFSYILPYTVPLMILTVNGALMGILLAFFVFNGAMTGFDLLGTKGIIIGMLYNMTYFFISIIPHGIIEIPAILVAATLGYRFAYVQAHDVIDKDLFDRDDIRGLQEDTAYTFATAKNYILSGYTWKMLGMLILVLLLAAYIEANVTLGIVDSVMAELDAYLDPLIS